MTLDVAVDTITVNRQKWEQCALAVGDDNPIHYNDYQRYISTLRGPICPGVYLFSLAENLARKNNYFEIPMHVVAKFKDFVYEDQNLKMKQESNGNGLSVSFIRDDNGLESKVAEFNFRKKLLEYVEFENNKIFESFKEDICPRDIMLFNDSLNITDGKQIYSTFVIGKVLKYFLRGRYGALLSQVEFDFLREIEIGKLDGELLVDDITSIKSIKGKNWTYHSYTVYGKVCQNGRLVGMGVGKGFYRESKN
ncbi:hypothetical protein J4221_01945 [Candidatus Pacearchaeota archaeon]|nr:hypothetical protein [Candidatus Pacearchaeota archaeon]